MRKLSKEIYFINSIVTSAQQLTDYLDSAFAAAQEIWTAMPGQHKVDGKALKNNHDEFSAAARKHIVGINNNFLRYEKLTTKTKADEILIFEDVNKFYHAQINLMSNLHNLIVEINNTQPANKTLRLELTPFKDIPLLENSEVKKFNRFFTNDVLRKLADTLDLHLRNSLETIEICIIKPQAKKLAEKNITARRHDRHKYEANVKGDMVSMSVSGSSMSGVSTYPQDGLEHELDIIQCVTKIHKAQAEIVSDALTDISAALEKTKKSPGHTQGNE